MRSVGVGIRIVSAVAAGALLLAFPSFVRGDEAKAELKLASLFGDNMVLQQQQAVPVWGWAAPGQSVTVTFGAQRKTAAAKQDGRWEVRLDPLKAGGPFEMGVASGSGALTLKNILVGEVWLCSGQSNMERPVSESLNAEKEIASAKSPNIRLFRVPRNPQAQPQTACGGSWTECSPSTVASFSAVGFYFGRKLNQTLNIPVGLIASAFGNTTIEAWSRQESLEQEPDVKYLLKRFNMTMGGVKLAIEKWKRDGEKGPMPQPADLFKLPTTLYNGQIAPLIPFAIRGAIWYQGESNDWRAYQYRKLLPMLIQDWRKSWGQGDFPFLFVQLANYGAPAAQPGPSSMAELCEAQFMTLSLPKTGMAVAIDVGDAKDIHPKNKQDVGLRLALWALATVYGQKGLVYSGPLYESHSIKGGKIWIKFKHVGGGLVAKGGPLKQFSIAGADQKFVWADARIEGDSVVVSSSEVPKPAAVRYAWANNPEGCNLYNAAGLPASPFRTDDWPGVTVNNK